jgi:ASC-1-like (ASCH) protein
MSRVKEKVLSNVPYSPYNVMAEIEDIQRKFPDKISLEDRVENALKYYKFWTELRPVRVKEYRIKQGIG